MVELTLIKMSGVNIAFDDGVKLQNTESAFFCLKKTIFHKKFADVFPARGRRNCITCVADVSAAARLF